MQVKLFDPDGLPMTYIDAIGICSILQSTIDPNEQPQYGISGRVCFVTKIAFSLLNCQQTL